MKPRPGPRIARSVSDRPDGPLARAAEVVVAIPRGTRQRVALHDGTLVGLEARVLALDRLNTLRAAVGGQRFEVG